MTPDILVRQYLHVYDNMMEDINIDTYMNDHACDNISDTTCTMASIEIETRICTQDIQNNVATITIGGRGDDFSSHYNMVTISGVRCVEWNFQTIPDDMSKANKDKERARRRRIKDYVGLENLDTPMLDSKMGRNGSEYCDILIITEQTSEWEAAMIAHFSSLGYTYDKKTFRSTGFQVTLYRDVIPIVHVNLYPRNIHGATW